MIFKNMHTDDNQLLNSIWENADETQKLDFCRRVKDDLFSSGYNCIIVLGPTAVGKTAVGVRLCDALDGEIISADSRQVYKSLDIGSGKDLCEFTYNNKNIPYHLIDITTLQTEYNVFSYQQDAYKAFSEIQNKNRLPIIVGGTGMYIDALIRNYQMLPVPENSSLRQSLESLSLKELTEKLLSLKQNLHNDTDTTQKNRLIRAIEIETFVQSPEGKIACESLIKRPDIRPFVLGTTFPREILRKKIASRLRSRLSDGMIDEVKNLHDVQGFSWQRLERLGLEYRFIAEFLQGKIKSNDELFRSLNVAIGQFAKRQETWFRGMEKKGVVINWIPADLSPDSQKVETRFLHALNMIANERRHIDL